MVENFKFPFEITAVDSETNKKLLEDFKGERTGFVQVGDKKYFFPNKFAEQAEKYYNIELHEDDIFIVSFPRSGTTLTQEMIWLIANDLNYKTASNIPLTKRFPFLEFGIFFHDDVKNEILKDNVHSKLNQELINHISEHGWEFLPKIKSPRFIKTHFPLSLLPKDWYNKKCKTIYIARNPKDVAISFYYLNKLFRTQGYEGNFEKYWNYFEQNLQPWMPYWSHIEEGWNHRHDPNILFMFYEDVTMNMPKSIKQLATFLGKSLNEEQIKELENHLSFENFKKNESVNARFFNELKITESTENFIRNGNRGNNIEFSNELNDRIQNWIAQNKSNIDIEFPKYDSPV